MAFGVRVENHMTGETGGIESAQRKPLEGRKRLAQDVSPG